MMKPVEFSDPVYYFVLSMLTHGPGQRSRYSDSLRPRRSADRISADARFSAPAQTTPVAHLASYTMSTELFPIFDGNAAGAWR
jgi:hypothetical protein